jgi:dienelactone hydrolase
MAAPTSIAPRAAPPAVIARRPTGPLGAAGRFVLGSLVLAAGVGLGPAHLVKVGWHRSTVIGLLALVAGMWLLVTSGSVVVRRVRGWRRALVVLGLILVVGLAVETIGQAVAATNVPPTSLGSATPADRGLDYEDVALRTADGVDLSGWYVPTRNHAVVVVLHGAGSTRSNVLDQATVLADHGYGVLLFDARGHGRSGGRAMDFGWYGDEDTAAAIDFATRQPGVDAQRIAVLGLSMGGEEAIGAAAADQRVAAVVAEGATNRVAADKAWLSEVYGWRGAAQEVVERLVYGAADLLSPTGPPISLRAAVAAAAPRPVLLIAGGAMVDEVHAARHIQAGSPATVQVWVAADTGHTDALATHPATWEARVTSFLDDALDVR